MNGESEQRESKEAVDRLDRVIVSFIHMEMNRLRHIVAMMVERAVMKLMLDDTKIMVLAL